MDETALDDLKRLTTEAMGADRRPLLRRVHGLRRALHAGKSIDQPLHAVRTAVERSVEQANRRRAAAPTPVYPLALPVSERREEIAEALRTNRVVIVCGETGSGKTTQLPKICLGLGRGITGTIGHTQPRRIAARSVAIRIAEELDTPLGAGVGYKVRFEDHTSPDTHIKLMTDGMLLAETQGDPWLSAYDTIIVDEAHERSLNIDFLLGYLKALLTRRNDLLVIVTSATIDPERFSRHFDDAPVIEVSGRAYPVAIRYCPPTPPQGEEIDWPLVILEALKTVFSEGPGDALVFLPGERHIRETSEVLRKHLPDVDCVPLFARLSAAQQQRIFEAHGRRRVVLATNVAETSLTVPGIRFVIDPGLARINRYSNRRKVQRLPIEAISQASANQRAGRCGRVEDGICVRLYAERAFTKRDAFTTPQILRSNLASVILQMKALGLGDIDAFPFLDRPRPGMIRDGYLTLYELGAVHDDGELTESGHALARLPIDPRLGRMLLEADLRGCLADMLVITSALSVRDPRERPPEARDDADRAHLHFRDPESDFLGLLKLWRAYGVERRRLGPSRLKRWCRTEHLSHARLREWGDVRRQLEAAVLEAGLVPSPEPAPRTTIHRAVLAGLLRHIGRRGDETAYQGAHGSSFWLWPGSTLASARPRWVVAGERVETTRLFARTVGPIEPEWIEPLAMHLVTREHYDPHWNAKKQQVSAYERVRLFGVEIVSKRRVAYGPIHPRRAREIFLRHALVHEGLRTRAPFFDHNRRLLDDLRGLEARARRTGILASAEDRFAFYDARVPADVCSGPALERWLKIRRPDEPRPLHMRREDLLLDPARVPAAVHFPDRIQAGELALRVSYRYEPGHDADGITARVPLETLGQIRAETLDWLVPGMLSEKLLALIRLLPKARRRTLVPLPDTVDQMQAHMDFGRGSLFEAMSAALERLGHGRIEVTTWQPERLPPHLQTRLAVVGQDGVELGAGRSLALLRRELLSARQAVASVGLDPRMAEAGLRTWSIGALPRRVAVVRETHTVHGYPALVDAGDTVSVRVVDTPREADRLMRWGILRLLALSLESPTRALVRAVPEIQKMRLWYGTLPVSVPLDRALADAIVARAAEIDPEAIRDEERFEFALRHARRSLATVAPEVIELAHAILARYHDIASKLMHPAPAPCRPNTLDMIAHLARLLSGPFLVDTPWNWLTCIPRYLDAIDRRLVRIGQGGLDKDRKAMQKLRRHVARYEARAADAAAELSTDPALDRYHWMLEEWRVSLFAQELGTRMPISEKRLDAQWELVSR